MRCSWGVVLILKLWWYQLSVTEAHLVLAGLTCAQYKTRNTQPVLKMCMRLCACVSWTNMKVLRLVAPGVSLQLPSRSSLRQFILRINSSVSFLNVSWLQEPRVWLQGCFCSTIWHAWKTFCSVQVHTEKSSNFFSLGFIRSGCHIGSKAMQVWTQCWGIVETLQLVENNIYRLKQRGEIMHHLRPKRLHEDWSVDPRFNDSTLLIKCFSFNLC